MGLAQQLEVGSDPRLLTLQEVIDAAVAGIRDDRPDHLIGAIFMSLNESKLTSPFVERSGGSLDGGEISWASSTIRWLL
jgi:hypothetical protein